MRKASTIQPRPAPARAGGEWTFLSNHAHVLVCLARNPEQTLREVSQAVGITERAVQMILADLEDAGIVSHTREGRRNRYAIHANQPLRHPVEAHRSVADLLELIVGKR